MARSCTKSRRDGGEPPDGGQVRTTLEGLERDGLVESGGAGADGRQPRLRITADGRRELAGWLRTPPDLASAPHDELATKILAARRVADTDVHEVIQVHRRHLVELMQQWTRIKQDSAGHDLGAALAVDAELFRLDSVIRWLDAADSHLERAVGDLSRAVTSAVDDGMRISDADRERATLRLREHYAEGRLHARGTGRAGHGGAECQDRR